MCLILHSPLHFLHSNWKTMAASPTNDPKTLQKHAVKPPLSGYCSFSKLTLYRLIKLVKYEEGSETKLLSIVPLAIP